MSCVLRNYTFIHKCINGGTWVLVQVLSIDGLGYYVDVMCCHIRVLLMIIHVLYSVENVMSFIDVWSLDDMIVSRE